jgi:NAD(P)-dependent dehydrogenase (short-subunit alcohol dehydrogenase family)
MQLEGKITLITGAGGGIGKAIALAFANEGADVVVNDVDGAKAEATASEVMTFGRKSIAIKADVSKENDVKQMFLKMLNELGGIDILVCNAGIGNQLLVEDMSSEDWHRVMGVNLDGPFYCSKAVIPTMRNRGGGKIIIISSLAARKMSIGNCAAYTASKSGLLGFVRHLAFEVGPYKINVNAILPGLTITPMVMGSGTHESIQAYKDRFPLRDVNRPEDIANAAIFLASSMSRTITGTTIDVDAGEQVVNQDWEGYIKKRKEVFRKKHK